MVIFIPKCVWPRLLKLSALSYIDTSHHRTLHTHRRWNETLGWEEQPSWFCLCCACACAWTFAPFCQLSVLALFPLCLFGFCSVKYLQCQWFLLLFIIFFVFLLSCPLLGEEPNNLSHAYMAHMDRVY